MSEIKWRFPGNNDGEIHGLNTGDIETFKSDKFCSLAREICQNSIDAIDRDLKKPVVLEFALQKIDRNVIPGIADLEHAIENAIDYWDEYEHGKVYEELLEMQEKILNDEYYCMKISDYNTTGLRGIFDEKRKNPWHSLVRSSAVSDKYGTAGGSKGIGKYATFVTSDFRTVFYSTLNKDGEEAYEGVCRLCSGNIDGTDEKTQGIGYYGAEKNSAIPGQFDIGMGKKRTVPGTDIYVFGFKMLKNWATDIISKLLESFCVAVLKKTLVIKINDKIIDSDTIEDITNSDLVLDKYKQSILSQIYLMKGGDDVFKDIIHIDDIGEATLYIKKTEEEDSTRKVTMVRYPFMKIKETKKLSALNFSGLCVIEDGEFANKLRDIENPQHTKWEFNRIEDSAVREYLSSQYDYLIREIESYINEHLAQNDSNVTDLEGAGDFISGFDEEGDSKSKNDGQNKVLEKMAIAKPVRSKILNTNAFVSDDKGNGAVLDLARKTLSGDDEFEFTEKEGFGSKNSGPINESNAGIGESTNSGSVSFKKVKLRSQRYSFACIDKNKGEYAVTFIPDLDKKDVSFNLFALDATGAGELVKISDCTINGNKISNENDYTIKFDMTYGQRIIIRMKTNQKDLFSGEVSLYVFE